MATRADRLHTESITQVGDVHMTSKHLLVLKDEEFMFDPYLVRSVEPVPENVRSRHGEVSRITFVDGGYQLLYQTDFDSLVSQIAEVFRLAQD